MEAALCTMTWEEGQHQDDPVRGCLNDASLYDDNWDLKEKRRDGLHPQYKNC